MENSLYNDLKKSIKFICKNRITYSLFLLIFILTIIILTINNKIILKKVYIDINIQKSPNLITKNKIPFTYFENKSYLKTLDNQFLYFHAEEIIYLVNKNFKKILVYRIFNSKHYINFLTEYNFTESDLEKFLEKYIDLYNTHNIEFTYKYKDPNFNKEKIEVKYTPIKLKKNEVFYKIEYFFDFKSILLIFIFFSFNATIICIIKEIYNENNK